MKNKTLTQLQSRKRWDNFNKAIFYFMLGTVFTALIYYIVIQLGYVEIIYK